MMRWIVLSDQARFPKALLRYYYCRHPSIRTLDERFFARCKLGVLVSVGAATCLSTFRPSLDGSGPGV
jgi:hypothetical protein